MAFWHGIYCEFINTRSSLHDWTAVGQKRKCFWSILCYLPVALTLGKGNKISTNGRIAFTCSCSTEPATGLRFIIQTPSNAFCKFNAWDDYLNVSRLANPETIYYAPPPRLRGDYGRLKYLKATRKSNYARLLLGRPVKSFILNFLRIGSSTSYIRWSSILYHILFNFFSHGI